MANERLRSGGEGEQRVVESDYVGLPKTGKSAGQRAVACPSGSVIRKTRCRARSPDAKLRCARASGGSSRREHRSTRLFLRILLLLLRRGSGGVLLFDFRRPIRRERRAALSAAHFLLSVLLLATGSLEDRPGVVTQKPGLPGSPPALPILSPQHQSTWTRAERIKATSGRNTGHRHSFASPSGYTSLPKSRRRVSRGRRPHRD